MFYFKKVLEWDFPGGPVVKIPCFHCKEHKFKFLVRELRSHMVQPKVGMGGEGGEKRVPDC